MLTRRTTDAPKGVWLSLPNLGYPQCSCRANMAQIRQSSPDLGLGMSRVGWPESSRPPSGDASEGARLMCVHPDQVGVLTRRTTDAPKGVWLAAPNLGYPQYYLNNFHYQVSLPPRPPSETTVTFKTVKSQIMVTFY